jgi:hypothetical protein
MCKKVQKVDISKFTIWSRCYDFKNIFAQKKFAKIMRFLVLNTASLYKYWIITLVFKKKSKFCCRKLAEIAKHFDHIIDPRRVESSTLALDGANESRVRFPPG